MTFPKENMLFPHSKHNFYRRNTCSIQKYTSILRNLHMYTHSFPIFYTFPRRIPILSTKYANLRAFLQIFMENTHFLYKSTQETSVSIQKGGYSAGIYTINTPNTGLFSQRKGYFSHTMHTN